MYAFGTIQAVEKIFSMIKLVTVLFLDLLQLVFAADSDFAAKEVYELQYCALEHVYVLLVPTHRLNDALDALQQVELLNPLEKLFVVEVKQ